MKLIWEYLEEKLFTNTVGLCELFNMDAEPFYKVLNLLTAFMFCSLHGKYSLLFFSSIKWIRFLRKQKKYVFNKRQSRKNNGVLICDHDINWLYFYINALKNVYDNEIDLSDV